MSPHVFEPSGTQFHYKMPINAVTSILNRVTGTALTVGARSFPCDARQPTVMPSIMCCRCHGWRAFSCMQTTP